MKVSLFILFIFFGQVLSQDSLKEVISKEANSQPSVGTSLKSPSRIERINVREDFDYSHNNGRKGSKDLGHSVGVRFSFSDYEVDKEIYSNQLKQVNELNLQIAQQSLLELTNSAHISYFSQQKNRLNKQYANVLKDLLGVLPKNEQNLIQAYSMEEKLIAINSTLVETKPSTDHRLLNISQISNSLNGFEIEKSMNTQIQAAALEFKKSIVENQRFLDFVGISSGVQFRENPTEQREHELERSVKLQLSFNIPWGANGGKTNKALIKHLRDKSKLLNESEENHTESMTKLISIKKNIIAYQKTVKLKSIQLARTELKNLTTNRRSDTTRILELKQTIIEHELKSLDLYEIVHRTYLELLYRTGKLGSYGDKL